MKKSLVAIVGILCALALTVSAAGGKSKKLTDDQQAIMKAMLEKYDTNKDGKLSNKERAKMSAEDKEKSDKAGLSHKKAKKTASTPDTGTNSIPSAEAK